jgi:hypothetical protein
MGTNTLIFSSSECSSSFYGSCAEGESDGVVWGGQPADSQFWVCNPRYPAGGDACLAAAHLIDLLQKQIQLPVAYIRQRASLQPGCVNLCEGVTSQHQPCNKLNNILNMGLVGVFIVYLNSKYQ